MDPLTLKILEKNLNQNPDDWDTRLHLAKLYFQHGNPSKALSLLEEKEAPADLKDYLLIKADILLVSDPIEALKLIDRLIQLDRFFGPAYLMKSKIHIQQGILPEAKKAYEQACFLEPQLADVELERRLEEKKVPQLRVVSGAAEEMPALSLSKVSDSSKITFADIGGMEEVKERIRLNLIYPLKNPQVFSKFKKKAGGGLLLYGPPGCGKTHIARATAGECGVPFISVHITDILSRWLGESEEHLHDFFEQARRQAPSVLFVDEIDALAMSRRDASSSISPLINVFLTEMDGIGSRNENVMVLGATNAPWSMDSAFRRPGRFDRVLFVPPPDGEARLKILEIYLKELPAESFDLKGIVAKTERFSGADLKALVDHAAEQAMMQEMKSGKESAINLSMMLNALQELKPSTLEWLETAKNYANFGNQAGVYDDLVEFFQKR